MEQYVVFSQLKDVSSRVGQVIGPFETYSAAANYAAYMCYRYPMEYFGVRTLDKTQVMPMK